MSLRQLDDNDGTKYLDGTAAPITTLGNDVWMKLPKFYWKCTEHATDVWDFSVAYGAKPDESFKEWDGKDLIGAYEAYVSSSKLYSVSDKNPSGNITQSNFKTYSRNRGDGFTLVKWKHHCMMAMLFYAYYCNTNSQAICGYSVYSANKTCGATNKLGMVDTIGNGGNGDSMSVNFWGLENWYGDTYEFLDNIKGNYGKWEVTEDDGSTRVIGTPVIGQGTILKMFFGDNIDLMPTEKTSVHESGFTDGFYSTSSEVNNVARSCNYNDRHCGVAFIAGDFSSSLVAASYGTRLSYQGDYIITD
jgi:hypothetical protein